MFMRFLWNLYGISLVCLWDFFGFPSRDSIVFLLDFYTLPMGFLLGSSVIP